MRRATKHDQIQADCLRRGMSQATVDRMFAAVQRSWTSDGNAGEPTFEYSKEFIHGAVDEFKRMKKAQ